MSRAREVGDLGSVTTVDGGNVGIGTSSPADELHISGVDPNIRLQTSSTGETGIRFFSGANDRGKLYWRATGETGFVAGVSGNSYYHKWELNGAERMRIDSAGRVTTPYQPSFIAFPSSNYSLSTGVTEIPCDTTSTNIGGHFNTSTNRFTAPVAGQYLFIVSVGLQNSSNSYTYLSAELLVNNALRFSAGWGSKGGSGYGRETYSVILTLGASDYVVPRTEFSHANFTVLGGSTGRFTSFSGHLLG